LNTRDALTQKPTSPPPTIMPEPPEIASSNQIEHQSSIVLAKGVEKRIQDVKEKKNKGKYISIHSLHKYSNIDISKILKYIKYIYYIVPTCYINSFFKIFF
jgi:hypothetical protein